MIACFLSNISAKYYKNPSMLSRVIAKNVRDVFFWDTVYIVSSLPLFAKTIKHYAARSFCDSWASCNERLSLKRKWLVCRCNPAMFTVQPVLTSSNQLVFLSPFDDGRLSSRFPVHYNVSFIMDGVKSVRKTFDVFRLLPNPRLLPFTGDRKNYRGEILSLKVNCVIFLTTR